MPQFALAYEGPLLLTHWGVSGPAVLKLSAWAARLLYTKNYQSDLYINWIPSLSAKEIESDLQGKKHSAGGKKVSSEALYELPKQLWKRLVLLSGIDEEMRWAFLTQPQLLSLQSNLIQTKLKIDGKTTYKQEFVTAGGVCLREINFKKMESKLVPGLFFAGEILDIDGITGGFNFQNAWTTGWIAGKSMGEEVSI